MTGRNPPPLAGLLPRALGVRHGVALGSALLAGLLGWAALAEVDIVVTAPAVARPAQGVAELRAPEARSVRRVLVREGSRVAAGSVLLELDREPPDRRWRAASAALEHSRRRRDEDRGLLRALDGGAAAGLPAAARARLDEHRSRLARLLREADALGAEVATLEATVAAARRQRTLAQARFAAVAAAAAGGAMTRFDRLRAQEDLWLREDELATATARLAGLRSRLAAQRHGRDEAAAGFRRGVLESLGATEVEIAELEARLAEADLARRRSRVAAPVAGIVDRLEVATGDFVDRGELLAVVVPERDGLLFEARIRPSQMAFLEPGQACRLKLDALPFARYGALDCRVERLGRDAVDEDGAGYFVARIRPATAVVEADGELVRLESGATALVDVVAGRRTVLGFVTEPLQRFTREALRER